MMLIIPAYCMGRVLEKTWKRQLKQAWSQTKWPHIIAQYIIYKIYLIYIYYTSNISTTHFFTEWLWHVKENFTLKELHGERYGKHWQMKASLSAIINVFIFRRLILFVGIAVRLLAHQLAPQKWVDAKSKSNRCNERLYSGMMKEVWDTDTFRCAIVATNITWHGRRKFRDRFKELKGV